MRTLINRTAAAVLTSTTFAMPTLGEGSELPDGSVTIPSLPFLATGDTSDNVDDEDAICPWPSTSPVVFYSVTQGPDHDAISVFLCESSSDTKLFILDDQLNEIACDDDACVRSPQFGFQSFLTCVPVALGETVHIAVDGWSGDAGPYEILVEACDAPPPCIFSEEMIAACPTNARSENEPCVEHAPDTVNGGCESTPTPLFTSINCGDTICGQLYRNESMADTDWFELTNGSNQNVTMTGVGELQLLIGLVNIGSCAPGAPECRCIGGTLDPFVITAPCDEGSIAAPHAAGRSWWFITTSAAGVIPCGSELPGNDYVAAWRCIAVPCCDLGDVDQNGTVEFTDLVILLSNWGPCNG